MFELTNHLNRKKGQKYFRCTDSKKYFSDTNEYIIPRWCSLVDVDQFWDMKDEKKGPTLPKRHSMDFRKDFKDIDDFDVE